MQLVAHPVSNHRNHVISLVSVISVIFELRTHSDSFSGVDAERQQNELSADQSGETVQKGAEEQVGGTVCRRSLACPHHSGTEWR